MSLSTSQRAAVERRGQDVCCVAGPGSGKTFVLVERFASLVESGVDPARILAITFTEKAATQIKDRVVRRFKDRQSIRRAVERAQVSTIHGLCRSLLSEHSIRAGIDPQFKVMDELGAAVEQSAAMDRVLDSLAANRRDSFLELAARWKSEKMERDLLSLYPRLRSAGGARRALSSLPAYQPEALAERFARELLSLLATPMKQTAGARKREAAAREWVARLGQEDLLEWSRALPFDGRSGSPGDPVRESIDSLREQLLAVRREAVGAAHQHLLPFVRDLFELFEEEYERRKRALAALDFDDLESKALALLERDPAVQQQVQERFDAVLMDELQDTNPIQWRIVDHIRRPSRFFAVGDPNQSIFGFRGAEPELFSRFRDSVKAGGEIDVLTENYRSRQEILDAATGALARSGRGVTEHKLTAAKPFPASSQPAVELLLAGGDADDILWTARRLRELYGTLLIGEEGKQRPARFSDMAILARTATPFGRIQEALARFGIPYKVERGSNFFEEPPVIDLVNLLRALDNPDDDIALFGVLRSPLFGVTDEEIALCRLEQRLAPPRAAERLDQLRCSIADAAPQPALARFLDETGFFARLAPQASANVAKFFSLLDKLAEEQPGDLRAWLDSIDQLRDSGKETSAPVLDAGDAITVLTIHKAKGLEFPIVAVVNVQASARGDTAPIAFRPELGLGLRWRDPSDVNQGIGDPIFNAVRVEDSRIGDGEEDRLLYVAMTRAEEKLLLSWREGTQGMGSDWPALITQGLSARIDEGAVAVLHCSGEPEILPPPEVFQAEPPPLITPVTETPAETGAVAVTTLAVFENCPWRYYLQFLAGWPQPETEPEWLEGSTEPGGAAFGTEVHNALAGLPAGEAARELAASFTSSGLGQRAASALKIFNEFDFLIELEGHLLRGQIDLWFEDGGGVVLVDYKTDRALDEARLAQYSMQLRYYALALEKLNGRLPDEAWLFDLRGSKPHSVGLTRPELDECLETWRRFQRMRSAMEYPARPGGQCARCPYSAGVCSSAQQS